MDGKSVNVITICGSLRKGSFNAMVQRALPSLAPEGMVLTEAPPFAAFPLYNADVQGATGFPGPVTALADAIRAADGVIIVTPEYNFSIPGGLKNAIDWVSRVPNQPFAGKPVALRALASTGSVTYTSQPICASHEAVISARTPSSSVSTMRAPRTAAVWSVSCTSCPPGALAKPGRWPAAYSSGVRTSSL